ncbi:fumarylacetoacetate hydrolase family protein [Paraburkholderia unamae]|uniref:2-keto-4-pentenoate hydratase/2-oxohepta-3-ene-1,7-dioic acid hydratase in catechol pathway n=1 Tax=Paraburkholderia unamae TaxID=219649 RepID=A0ABX5KV60_9BURK|nr:fumarylacetoacetate hydrolase family protein [Paraburkholderia unamae]PVX85861.1 2-keto-4-pentenoate hydratase/2-oxohepta-3-ene-1,7-dioic acid hydratase in catechol pathway [Paraburkholderia unamae]
MNFGIATVLTPAPVGALEIGETYWTFDVLMQHGIELPSVDVKALFSDWSASVDLLEKVAEKCAKDPEFAALGRGADQVTLGVPLLYPNKVIAVGANYASHLEEMGLPVSRWEPLPFFFKPPTTTLVGPGKTVKIQPRTRQLDWEIELAVVVGARLSDASLEQAKAAIAGYSIGLDMSARDWIQQPDSPLKVDLMRGKCQDTMCPLGPIIRPSRFVPDPHQLRLQLSVNGEPRQDASTAEMLYRIEEQLSLISQFITLEPGDIVLTGSPAGSGVSYGSFLKHGDRISASIEGIGTLNVEVAEELR